MNTDHPSPEIITFYSYQGGSGRTMAVANLAWILASNGLRVLAVDWDLESPGLHRYFHPFLRDKQLRQTTGVIDMVRDYASAAIWPPADDSPDWIASYTRVLQHAVSLDWPFPGEGTIDFLAAGKQDRSYADTVSTFDWANFFERLGGAEFLHSLRRDMLDNYDYVLIDSRTGLSDTAGIGTVVLPDVVVDCFTMSTQSMEGAATVAHAIRSQRSAGEPLRILPVPMRVEDAEQDKLEAGREYARRVFEPFLTDLGVERVGQYWGDVEIPYKPFYAYEEILTPFGDLPQQHNSLLAAFERLTAVVTDGRITEAPVVPEWERRRFLAEFERLRSPVAADVLISYASVDRMWAEWISGELTDGGLTVHLRAVDSTIGSTGLAELEQEVARSKRVVVLVSHDYTQVPSARSVWKIASRSELGTLSRQLVPIRLDAARLPAPFDDQPPIELALQSEDRARLSVDTLERYERVLGPDHSDTLLCDLTVARTYAGIGDDERAHELALSTLDNMVRILNDEHVLTKVCRHNLTIFMLKLDAADEALPAAEGTLRWFGATLGPRHPYTLTAALNLANIRWAVGDRAGARELDEATYLLVREVLGEDHPDTLSAAVNLAVSRDGEDPRFVELVAQKVRAFSDRHPRIAATVPGERINAYIDPPSP